VSCCVLGSCEATDPDPPLASGVSLSLKGVEFYTGHDNPPLRGPCEVEIRPV
jgi:hypothetical protein